MVISGIIRPPPEIRAVADRTALYVAKNGRAFEARILSSEKGKTPKFAFLHATSPFHAYYEQKVQFYENGGEDEKEEDKKDNEKLENVNKQPEKTPLTQKTERSQKASVVDPVAKALLVHRQKIVLARAAQEEALKKLSDPDQKQASIVSIASPPPLQFVNIVAPASLSVAQIETIQLVAQFTALDGKNGQFLSKLTFREWNNPNFAFCQPRHGHFAYFSAMVDAYRSILTTWTADSSSSHINNQGQTVVEIANSAEKCLDVAAYRAEYERDREAQMAKGHDNADGLAQIDWHDFIVVETIEFPPEELVEMMPPPSQLLALENTANEADETTMEESDGEDEVIRVVPSYTPRVVASQPKRLETMIDPITGKSVAINDLPEHMRIQLLDPKWAEERKKFQEKQKDSNLVSGDMVASNLARFTQARGDAFGTNVRYLRAYKF
jgi:splicing factor 3A subunit 1